MGHGEWINLNEEVKDMRTTQEMAHMSTWERIQLETENVDLMKARIVREKGYPNMFGARIPVKTNWNIEKLKQLLEDYEDKEVIEELKFG